MLAQTLRALAADGFVERTVIPAAPPQVSYRLTATGDQVAAHVVGLVGWIEQNLPAILAARETDPSSDPSPS
jgi:DNA-binding HxlR family transcriptional regulator